MTSAGGAELVEVVEPLRLARNIPVQATSASVGLSSNPEAITGWSFREATGSASADIQLIDGNNSNSGDIIAEITLNPGQSIRDHTGPIPLRADRGIWLQVNAGSVRGSVWSRLLMPK